MELIESFTIKCCDIEKSFEWKHDAIKFLLNHIKEFHKDLYEKLEKEGRKLAMSENGRGYWDDGKSPDGMWFENEQFQKAWIETALEYYLKDK